MENLQEQPLLQMNLDYDGGHILHETVRWSRFLSIVGIVAISLMALVFAFAGTTLLAGLSSVAPGITGLASMGGAVIILAAVLVIAVCAFSVFMLYRFSVLTRRGIDQQDQAVFTEGIKCLKVYFIVSGIFAIFVLLAKLASLISLFLINRFQS